MLVYICPFRPTPSYQPPALVPPFAFRPSSRYHDLLSSPSSRGPGPYKFRSDSRWGFLEAKSVKSATEEWEIVAWTLSRFAVSVLLSPGGGCQPVPSGISVEEPRRPQEDIAGGFGYVSHGLKPWPQSIPVRHSFLRNPAQHLPFSPFPHICLRLCLFLVPSLLSCFLHDFPYW